MRYTEFTTQRIALCDLLIGRVLRLQAEEVFEAARLIEEKLHGAPLRHLPDLLDAGVERAAHIEWIAVRAELGQINWGGRFNRCGYHAHMIDERTAALTWGDVLNRDA